MSNSKTPNVKPDLVEWLPAYTSSPHGALFHWLHVPKDRRCRDVTVIICAPMGYEYIHAHHTLKYLADDLAEKGFPVYRFDFHGVGNSPGDELCENKLSIWQDEIAAVVAESRRYFPDNKICLLGLRFGATLAYLASATLEVDQLILWEPVINGKPYIREMTAIARLAWDASQVEGHYIEAAGFLISEHTAHEIKQINLLHGDINFEGKLLLIGRDNSSAEADFYNLLIAGSVQVDRKLQTDFVGMMAEPHEAVLPEATLADIENWLIASAERVVQVRAEDEADRSIVFRQREGNAEIVEKCCWYDQGRHLFGVESFPSITNHPCKRVVILLNSGSVHHVGPNRIYTHLSRNLAERGVICLRLDIEGLGDSCKKSSANKSHPYQTTAVRDAFAAIAYMKAKYPGADIVVAGLCSGAHTAFHTALQCDDNSVVKEILLINPLTFYWQDGMSLSAPSSSHQLVRESMRYSQSIKSRDSWKRLISGKVSIVSLAKFLVRYIVRKGRGYLGDRLESIFNVRRQLAKDLVRLRRKKIAVSFLFSSTDPGLKIVNSEAAMVFKQGLSEGAFSLDVIDGADHTFSRKSRREIFYDRVCKKYGTE